MAWWLLKTEPSTFSVADLEKDGQARWDGVRNYAARNHLQAMKQGDACFIYHSGDDKHVVGVAEVVRGAYPDPTVPKGSADERKGWVCVDVRPRERLARPVTLAELKAHRVLRELPLVKQSRLSVSPVSEAQARELLALAAR